MCEGYCSCLVCVCIPSERTRIISKDYDTTVHNTGQEDATRARFASLYCNGTNNSISNFCAEMFIPFPRAGHIYPHVYRYVAVAVIFYVFIKETKVCITW